MNSFVSLITIVSSFIPSGLQSESTMMLKSYKDTTVQILYDPKDSAFTHRLWQGVPTVAVLPNEELWVAWYSGGKGEGVGNYVTVAKSLDNGKVWQKNVLIVQPKEEYRVFDPCLWYDARDQKLHLYWSQSYKQIWDGVGGVWSIKKGVNDSLWSAPTYIADGVMLNKPNILSKSKVIMPIAYWDKLYNVLAAPKDPAEVGANVFIQSGANGKASYTGKIPMVKEVEDYPEHQIVTLKNGNLWGLVRGKNGIYQSISKNNGKTWTNAKLFQIAGGKNPASRFHIQRLSSGNLLLVVNDHRYRTNLTAFLSSDDGKTWPYKVLIDGRANVTYPDADEDEKGNIYIVYDRDRFSAKEIILVKLTEKFIIDNTGNANPPIEKIIIDN